MGHTNINECKLKTIDGKPVIFVTTNKLAEALYNAEEPGKFVVFYDGNKGVHSLWVAGEHIAGGYGFNDENTVSNVETLLHNANLEYLLSHKDDIVELINGGSSSDPTVSTNVKVDATRNTIEINGTVYTLSLTSDNELYIDKDANTEITKVELTYNTDKGILFKGDDIVVLPSNTKLTLNTISCSAEGTLNITNTGMLPTSVWDSYGNSAKINASQQLSKTELTPAQFSKFNVSIPDEYGFFKYSTFTKENITVLYKDKSQDKNAIAHTANSVKFVWQQPYFYGSSTNITVSPQNFTTILSNNYRKDDINMLPNDVIEITFSNNYAGANYGYFACPVEWGTPKFILEKSNIKSEWIMQYATVNTEFGSYNIYRTPLPYYNGKIKWILG